MRHRRSAPKAYLSLLWVAVFFVVVLGVVYWARRDLVPFFGAFPILNGVIVGLLFIGLCLSVLQLVRLLVEARRLDALSSSLAMTAATADVSVEEAVQALGSGLVADRCLRTLRLTNGLSARISDSLGLLSDADVESEEGRAIVVRYLLGVLVFLGLMGTFWGVLVTVSGVQQVLAALEPERIDDAVMFLTQLKSSMGGMLGGLSTSFSTSLFGLGSSVILGFVDAQTRRVRAGVLSDLDRFVVSVLLPATEPDKGAVVCAEPLPRSAVLPGGELYLSASQQALAETLRRLTDVITAQASMDAKITESLMEMKGMLEALREEENIARENAQMANQMRQGMLERLDNLGRHMERVVKELRVNRDAADEIGKSLLDGLKLEGEITNKTLSIGFSDLNRKVENLGLKTEKVTSMKRTETDGKQES